MLRTLTYHRVARAHDYPDLNPRLISADPDGFARQLDWLSRRFAVVGLPQVLAAAKGGPALPSRAVLITFDDGYRDFAEVAWPLLRARGLPATLFVATDYPDNPSQHFWWDRLYRGFRQTGRRAVEHPRLAELTLETPEARNAALNRSIDTLKNLPHADLLQTVEELCTLLGVAEPADNGILGWQELVRLAEEGLSLGAHTRTHPVLTQLPVEKIRAEVSGSFSDLRERLGEPLPVFAYPGGFHDATVEVVLHELGVTAAFTTRDGFNPTPFAQPLRLCRTNITLRSTPWVFRLRLTRLGAQLDRLRH